MSQPSRRRLPLEGVEGLYEVDPDIFRLRYFQDCMRCDFCHDSCCSWGADVAVPERDRILRHADALKAWVPHSVEKWFTSEVKYDDEYEGGAFVRTQVADGRCVFLNRQGRGCLLHAFALNEGRDYHPIKPMVCWLFPVIFDRGLLRPNFDVRDGLICVDRGPTLYRSSRDELRVRFGEGLIQKLDRMELAVLQEEGEREPELQKVEAI
jgi:Fe-S-cluster containining protein